VAVVVGEFESVEGMSEEGILVRVFTPIGKKEQVGFVAEPFCENGAALPRPTFPACIRIQSMYIWYVLYYIHTVRYRMISYVAPSIYLNSRWCALWCLDFCIVNLA
jgi:hypothetical protein